MFATTFVLAGCTLALEPFLRCLHRCLPFLRHCGFRREPASNGLRLRDCAPPAARTTNAAFRRIVALLLFAAIPFPVAAKVYCVNEVFDYTDPWEWQGTNTTGLLNALILAEQAPGGTDQEIRLEQGVYALGEGVLRTFDEAHDEKAFSLLGGYESVDAPCDSRQMKPANTILSADSGAKFELGDVNQTVWRSFRMEGITFEGFSEVAIVDDNCESACNSYEPAVVKNNQFFVSDVLFYFNSNDGQLVTSNLFVIDGNVRVIYEGDGDPPEVAFNTFSTKCQEPKSYDSGVELSSFNAIGQFHHNVVEASGACAHEVVVESSEVYEAWEFRNNILESVVGTNAIFPAGHGNIIGSQAVDVGFVDLEGLDFHLRTAPASPAINAGMTLGEAFQMGMVNLPTHDIDGSPRPIGLRFDMGAYESSIGGGTPLTVTKANDDGLQGSLSWAIQQANSDPGPQIIQFQLSDTCPATITLADGKAPPAITDDVVIDGYTQPCAVENTDAYVFNGKTGIRLVEPEGGLALGSAVLRVPADAANAEVSLVVQGLNFHVSVTPVAAIELANGTGHGIFGNIFGSFVADESPGVTGVRVTTPGTVAIGGPEPSQRNVFGNFHTPAGAGRAIVVNHPATSATIENNLIGITPAANIPWPVDTGILVQAGTGVAIKNNLISAAGSAIWLLGADTLGAKMTGNRLGTLPDPNAGMIDPDFANAFGIRISSASGGHFIGNTSTSSRNTITNTQGPGVLIASTAGDGTRIGRNKIYGVGMDGVSLAVDLGSPGPQPNDPNDVDNGPNELQNHPLITSSSIPQGYTRQVQGTLSGVPGVSHTIDVYRSATCPGERGELFAYVGSVQGVTPAANGEATFQLTVSLAGGASGYLTAIATALPAGNSSEPSPCFMEPAAVNTAPQVLAQAFTVVETAQAGTVIGTVQATDDGLPDGTLDYSINSGNESGAFALLPANGVLLVNEDNKLDAAVQSTYTLTVKVSDGPLSSTGSVTVNVVTAELFRDGFE